MPETETRSSKSPSNRCRLNEQFIRTVKAEAKRKLCWDTVQPGLVLAVEPSGHKSFKLIYTFNGRASKKKVSTYELRRAQQTYDRRRIDKRTRVGRLALQAIHTRGRKSQEQQAALAAVGYPGY